jgi:hypothetical protein
MSAKLLLLLAMTASSTRVLHAQTRLTNNARVNNDGNSDLQKVSLADLPYDYNALEPYIGEETLRIHHDKHHAKYVATTNTMISGTDLENMDIVSILRMASPGSELNIVHFLIYFIFKTVDSIPRQCCTFQQCCSKFQP